MTGIYFHIPFCARKCPYCDFFSVPYQRETADAYVGAILRNLRAYRIADTVDSIYFGGGTPSLLTPSQIGTILSACAQTACLSPDTEITLEYNPTGRRDAYLRDLRRAGVNRLSIGTQSFSDAQLRLLGRTHTAEDNRRAVMAAADAGFANISCDLMLAVPEQTSESLDRTIGELVRLPITHVSAYMLQVEEGTPLSRNAQLLSRCPDDDQTADLYLQAVRTLEAAGLAQYEISSFSRRGYESVHNCKYWNCEPYLGIGAGAHSCFDGRRFSVPGEIGAFLQAPRQREVILSESPCDREERLMLALRLTQGVPETALSGNAVRRLPPLLQAGYVRNIGEGRISLTPEGFAVSNAVIAELIG